MATRHDREQSEVFHVEPFLNMDELAEVLGVSRRWIQERILDAGLPHYRLGPAKRLIRFKYSEVFDWMKETS